MLTASVVFKPMKRFTIQISADQLTELADERMKLSIFEKKADLKLGSHDCVMIWIETLNFHKL